MVKEYQDAIYDRDIQRLIDQEQNRWKLPKFRNEVRRRYYQQELDLIRKIYRSLYCQQDDGSARLAQRISDLDRYLYQVEILVNQAIEEDFYFNRSYLRVSEYQIENLAFCLKCWENFTDQIFPQLPEPEEFVELSLKIGESLYQLMNHLFDVQFFSFTFFP